MAKTSPPAETPEENFESAMGRLEAIVAAMESDELPLEELIVRYEEGIRLVQVCERKLKAAEKKIEIITRRAAGNPELAEFEPEAKSPPTQAAAPPRGDVSLF